MCHTRSEDSFERGVNAGQQSADSVADAGCFTGEIVIETDQHTELGECVITGIDSSQRVAALATAWRRMRQRRILVQQDPLHDLRAAPAP